MKMHFSSKTMWTSFRAVHFKRLNESLNSVTAPYFKEVLKSFLYALKKLKAQLIISLENWFRAFIFQNNKFKENLPVLKIQK